LPRDAIHQRGLCRRAVSARLSVSPSRSCPLSKRVSIFIFFTILVYGNISSATPTNFGKNRDFRPYLALASITARPSRVVNIQQWSTGYV